MTLAKGVSGAAFMVTTFLWYGPPVIVRVVLALARFMDTTFRCVRCALKPDAPISMA